MESLVNIVSDLTLFDISAFTAAGGGTGDLTGLGPAASATVIDTVAQTGSFSVGGFVFTIDSVTGIVPANIACDADGLCRDAISFDIRGAVTGNGFDPATFIGVFSS